MASYCFPCDILKRGKVQTGRFILKVPSLQDVHQQFVFWLFKIWNGQSKSMYHPAGINPLNPKENIQRAFHWKVNEVNAVIKSCFNGVLSRVTSQGSLRWSVTPVTSLNKYEALIVWPSYCHGFSGYHEQLLNKDRGSIERANKSFPQSKEKGRLVYKLKAAVNVKIT